MATDRAVRRNRINQHQQVATRSVNPIPALYVAAVALLLMTFALRIHRLDAVPLRGDEAYSVMHWTATPFSEDWQQLIRMEPAPVGAFTMYWAWSGIAGRTEFALRYLSVLGNLIGAAAVMALGRRILGPWSLGLLAGVLWAVHPYLIWHAQDARVYGVLSALSPLSFYWLLRALEHTKRRQHVQYWWPYILLQTTALYIYYLEPFWMLAQGLYVLSLRRQSLARMVKAWIVIGLLAIPVVIQVLVVMFVGGYEGNAESSSITDLLSLFVPTLLFGEHTIPVWLGAVVVVVLATGIVHAVRCYPQLALLAFWLVVPPLLLYGTSFFFDFFRPRYVTTVIPALILALVAIPASFASRRQQVVVTSGLALIIAILSLVQVRNYFYFDPPKSPDWPGLVTYLSMRTSPHDVLISDSIDPSLEYYFDGPAYIAFIPLDDPPAESFMLPLLDQYEAFFLLAGGRTGAFGQYLQEHTQHIPGDSWPNVSQYRQWNVNPEEIAKPEALHMGDIALLRGYTLQGDTVLLLYWEALAMSDEEHSVLLHIVPVTDEPSPPAAVLDHGIAGAVVSTRTWTPGTLYRDPVALPQDLPPGEYEIWVGLYAIETGTMLPIGDGSSGTGERHLLTTYQVTDQPA